MRTLVILLVMTMMIPLVGCQRRPILVGPLSAGGTMPLGMWVDEVRQPGFEELKRGETEHAYWAVFGNPLGFVHVAFEARTPAAAGESAETRLVLIQAPAAVADNFGDHSANPGPDDGGEALFRELFADDDGTSNWGQIERMPTRPWQVEPGVVSMIPVGGVERVPASYMGEIRALVVVDGYKTLVDAWVWWPPGSPPVAIMPASAEPE